MSEFEKKAFDVDSLFKMLHDTQLPAVKECTSCVDVAPRKPFPTRAMQLYSNALKPNEPIEDEVLLSTNGWLLPDGTLYSCRWQEHTKSVNTIGYDTEREAIMAGLIKLSNMGWQLGRQYTYISLTKEQKETIDTWHEKNGISREFFMFHFNRTGQR